MNSVIRLSARAGFVLAVGCLLAFIGMAFAADQEQLAGKWNFNAAQSDDAQQKVQQAQQAQQAQQTSPRGPGSGGYPGGNGYPGGAGYPAGGGYPTGGGYPGTGGYPGGGGIGRGGMGPGGMGNAAAGLSSQEWQELAKNPAYLNITQHPDQIVIADSESSRTLYPDGKKHKAMDENGNKISTKTQWRGDELVSESRMGSGRLTDTYQISSDGKELIVVSRYESASLSQPLVIRRVYDLENSGH
jgi:hypothetical protein